MSPREESSEDTSCNSTYAVVEGESIFDASSLEKSERHLVVAETDSGVDGSTGVRSSNEDHAAKSHGDSENSEHVDVVCFIRNGEEASSHSILADKVSHHKDESTHGLDEEGLCIGDSTSGSQVRELGSTLSVSHLLVLDQGVDNGTSTHGSTELRSDHQEAGAEVHEQGVVSRGSFTYSDGSVDPDSDCDSGVVMASRNLSSKGQEEEEYKADSSGATSSGVDASDEQEGANKLVKADDGGVASPASKAL